jgi:hypothetical protein
LHASNVLRAQFDLAPPVVRMTKVEAKLYVEVDGIAAPDTPIAREHEMRLALVQRLAALPFDVWLNFELFPDEASRDSVSPGTD